MGRINVTIRIFVGTLVPNNLLRNPGSGFNDRAQELTNKTRKDFKASDQTSKHGRRCMGAARASRHPCFVTVLAQDHCYSDLLRFVLTTDSISSPAMTSKHCPSA